MIESILTSVKRGIGGIPEEYETFDNDVLVCINSEIAELDQLGVIKAKGVTVVDKSTTWDEIVEDPCLNFIQQYVTIKVKMIFDPPQSGLVMDALKQKAEELKWRINVAAEQYEDNK